MDEKFIIRQLQNNEEFLACEALELEIWGQSFSECVPPSLLMVSQKVGGVTARAFDEKDGLIGFVYGLTGWKDGRLVHWSHMLAVRKEHRDKHLGIRLKEFQKDFVQKLGVEIMYWTYDPLVARNAHINLNRLGVSVEEYVPHMYVEGNEADLHRGIGMDRFVVKWDLSQPNKDGKSKEFPDERFVEAPIINTIASETSSGIPTMPNLTDDSVVRVEIPCDIHAIQEQSLEIAATWRECTRPAFVHYLERDYRVAGFHRDRENGRCFYGLTRNEV
jgi:predicted GNAT superfamily acetyltransferase